jgi:hypothetical protein
VQRGCGIARPGGSAREVGRGRGAGPRDWGRRVGLGGRPARGAGKAFPFILFFFLPLVLLLKTCFSFEFNSNILPKFE